MTGGRRELQSQKKKIRFTISKLGRFGRLAFPGKPGTNPEAHWPALAGIRDYQYGARLDVPYGWRDQYCRSGTFNHGNCPQRGQKGSRLHKTQKKLVSSPTTKGLEVFGTMRADFIVCGIGSDVRDFLDNKGAVY
jgi:hypothetical protein